MNLKFNTPAGDTFYADLTKRVNQYFKSSGIKKTGNLQMKVKTAILLIIYFTPYAMILFLPMPWWGGLLCSMMMGAGMAGIGMSVMHDACHGSYSTNQTVNKIMGYTMNMLGANKYNWTIQHNVKHHTFTNVYGADEDLDNGNLIRLSPFSKYSKIHKFQHFYSWFLYTLGTLAWVTTKDFKMFFTYKKENYVKNKQEFWKELSILFTSKVAYYGYIMVLPLLFSPWTWWQIIIGFVMLHFVSGFILSVTFQLAHIVENKTHEKMDKPVIESSWAVHQLKTTANFARKSRFLNWYLGGLNFQIEHHLFPHICHIHYKKLSDIVRNTVKDHGLEYHEFQSMFSAIKSHYRILKVYGQQTTA